MPIDELVPATSNPKRHARSEIQASMQRFSFTEPVLLDERTGRLVAGHGRVETLLEAKQSGLPPPRWDRD